jgi:hypothetical protein
MPKFGVLVVVVAFPAWWMTKTTIQTAKRVGGHGNGFATFLVQCTMDGSIQKKGGST